MFSHVTLGSNDLDRSKRFYDAIMGVLGVPPSEILEHPLSRRLMYRQTGQHLSILEPINGEPANTANGLTIGFGFDDPKMIDAWHAAGVAAGGTSVEDPPGIRVRPTGRLYLAYLRDPDGHKLCALHYMDAKP